MMKSFVAVVILLDITIKEAHCQLVTAANQTAKEGDAEVVMTCDYSQFTTAPDVIQWDELNEDGFIINSNLVNDKKLNNGRFTLNITPRKADLGISQPMRGDSKKIFHCEIRKNDGYTEQSNPSILTVYYLDQPLLIASESTIYEGQLVTFTCSIPDGDPIPHITWYKDGQTVNTNNPSRYEIANNSTESVLKIKSATEEDAGNYTCKAESDQFKGENAKTSEGKHLIVYYITVTFTSEDGIATCTADGHPKPSLVLILQDGKVAENEENTTTIKIEICQSILTCYAENARLNETTTLENCNVAGPGSFYIILIALIVVCLFLWLLLLVYFMYYKNIEWSNTDINTVTVEGGKPVEMSFKYRPSIARFKTVEIKKEDKVIGSNQQQFSSWKTVCQFVCYCCLYFCGFFCVEYCIKSFRYKNKDKRHGNSGEEYQMMDNETEVFITSSSHSQQQPITISAISGQRFEINPDDEDEEHLAEHQGTSGGNAEYEGRRIGRSITKKDKPVTYADLGHGRNPTGISGKDKKILPESVKPKEIKYVDLDLRPSTSKKIKRTEAQTSYFELSEGVLHPKANDSPKRSSSYTMSTNGRGGINLTIPNPVRSHSGEYHCSIDGSRQQYRGVNNLSVYWIEMVNPNYSTERGVSNFEMKCRYGPADMPLTGYKWKKIKEDGTTEIKDGSKDGRFEVTSYQNSILSLKIKNFILGNAGKYQCEVKPVDGEKKLEDSTQLTVKEAALKMEIPDVTTNEG
ncbi:uncharacterized protein [Antedon mediterranea]|uniref:uncharacterized protein isoform X2 n=1 Tax=Antedon mediterranea TaxID=105859 RepID=UPI003AF845D6